MNIERDMELVIWDSQDNWQSYDNNILLWNSSFKSELDGVFSIPWLVEHNADSLRSEYLSIIYELGEFKVNGLKIVDQLEIRKNFSYWWMTLLTEKCNFSKSPEINDIIKLLAFKNWFNKNKYKKISLISSNIELAESFELLAEGIGLEFEWIQRPRSKIKKTYINNLFHLLPQIVQSITWLIHHIVIHWPLKGVGVSKWINTTATTTFISYLFNLEPSSLKDGKYESKYWTRLPDMLNQNQTATNWLHLYMKDDLLPTTRKAREIVENFNKSSVNNQTHVTLHSFLSFKIVINALFDWLRLLKLKGKIRKPFQHKSNFLWPLFRKDFSLSFSGVTAVSNLLYLGLFEVAMNSLKKQNKGVYLLENIGWEFGFIYAWKSSGHQNLIGCRHGTVRYWDLRSFFSNESYKRMGKCDLPLPDYVGVNGIAAKEIYINSGYPKNHLVEIEALRFLYLLDIDKNRVSFLKNPFEKKKVLVLGDGLKKNTIHQIKLLISASKLTNDLIHFIFKPHPTCPINTDKFDNLHIEVVNNPIHTLFAECELVFAGSVSSAAVDAYCAGKQLVCLLNSEVLNLSPLRGHKDVDFITSPEELAEIFNKSFFNPKIESQREDYFYLNSNLPRWKNFLSEG
jgi:surface carbohydrate biosynthesis protein (TIGR04326 family)